MWLVPYTSFTVLSIDPVQVVRDRLAANVESWTPFYTLREHKPYFGTVQGESFEVRRAIHYRNSFLPVAYGHFATDEKGTAVQISLYPHAIGSVLLGMWMLFWVALFFRRVIAQHIDAVHWGEAGMIVGMLTFGWLLLLFCFWFEAPRYRQELTRIITATKSSPVV